MPTLRFGGRVMGGAVIAVLALGLLPGLVSAKPLANYQASCSGGTATATWANASPKVAQVDFAFSGGSISGANVLVSPPKARGSISLGTLGATSVQVSWFDTAGGELAFTGVIACT